MQLEVAVIAQGVADDPYSLYVVAPQDVEVVPGVPPGQ